MVWNKMIKITQEFETEIEARVALSYNAYWGSLFDMDEWLRTQIKHGVDLTDDQEDVLAKAREQLRDIMDSHSCDLLE